MRSRCAPGAKPLITISLPRFGSLTGNVVGRFGSRADSPTQPIALTDAQLVVTARRVLSLDTNGGTRQFTAVNDPPVPAVVDPNDPNGFSVSGPPGAYLIDISHPQYSGLAPSLPARRIAPSSSSSSAIQAKCPGSCSTPGLCPT